MKLHSPQATHTLSYPFLSACSERVGGVYMCVFCKFFLSHTILKVQNKSIKISKIITFISFNNKISNT